jgi:zinc transport system substrate-binding protein
MRNIIIYLLALPALALVDGCGGEGSQSGEGGIVYVATIHPVAAIMREVAGDRAEVVRLLGPGASPHTYAPNPSDVRKVQNAAALVCVGSGLDAWAVDFSVRKKIALMELLPAEYRLRMAEHVHGGHGDGVIDPHFWMDPLAVKAVLPALVEVLCELDPEGGGTYRANAERFGGELDALHEELRAALLPVKGRPVFLFHPSMNYLLKRYGLEFAGVIERFAGRDPSAAERIELIEKIKAASAKAIFTEPQLPEDTALSLAQDAGVEVGTLDPIGGVEGRDTYSDLLRYNARTLVEYLK